MVVQCGSILSMRACTSANPPSKSPLCCKIHPSDTSDINTLTESMIYHLPSLVTGTIRILIVVVPFIIAHLHVLLGSFIGTSQLLSCMQDWRNYISAICLSSSSSLKRCSCRTQAVRQQECVKTSNMCGGICLTCRTLTLPVGFCRARANCCEQLEPTISLCHCLGRICGECCLELAEANTCTPTVHFPHIRGVEACPYLGIVDTCQDVQGMWSCISSLS